MSLKKLELQKIENLVFERKKDENSAIISIFNEICELKYFRGLYTFRKQITQIHEMDADFITRTSRCLEIAGGSISIAHVTVRIIEERIYTVLLINESDITNIKTHERIQDYMGVSQYMIDVYTRHMI